MHHVRVGATDLMECNDCASTWLDAETFMKLCADREQRGMVASMVGSTPRVARPQARVRYHPCPKCGKTMNRQNFGRRSGVIIDVCKGHGAWFEHGELQAVMSFVDKGGLEQTRRIEDEMRREEHRRMIEALRSLMTP